MVSPEFTVYSTGYCSYCVRARRLLESRQWAFSEIRVDLEPKERDTMASRSGRTSVPQVFLGARHIGGYDDLVAAVRSGNMDVWLQEYAPDP